MRGEPSHPTRPSGTGMMMDEARRSRAKDTARGKLVPLPSLSALIQEYADSVADIKRSARNMLRDVANPTISDLTLRLALAKAEQDIKRDKYMHRCFQALHENAANYSQGLVAQPEPQPEHTMDVSALLPFRSIAAMEEFFLSNDNYEGLIGTLRQRYRRRGAEMFQRFFENEVLDERLSFSTYLDSRQ